MMAGVADDVIAIQQVLARYVIAVDTRTPELLRDCFTADAVLRLSGMPQLTVDAYVAIAGDALPKLDATLHHLGLPAIRVEDDRAWSRCYFMANHVRNALAPAPTGLMIGGWYDDELVRTDAGWRIAQRIGTAMWAEGNSAVIEGADYPLGATPRGPGHAAPGWL
ncbi:nuclear transport factor 2 family protein [Sphingomonas sp. KC8]|uniref:nuclear transport factor 2 family protein n=1 Tax=Sphingomonas sp. KC8 TaxID=1030157 RepID=UPI0002488F93|nr:nuclear transport factor 2 family protein [Sphingomonas sp. KC8]ARS29279.1 hypothetical protein KC8_18560 [Sphingomonas sp. KC8]